MDEEDGKRRFHKSYNTWTWSLEPVYWLIGGIVGRFTPASSDVSRTSHTEDKSTSPAVQRPKSPTIETSTGYGRAYDYGHRHAYAMAVLQSCLLGQRLRITGKTNGRNLRGIIG